MESSIFVNLDEDTLDWIDQIYDSQSGSVDLNLVKVDGALSYSERVHVFVHVYFRLKRKILKKILFRVHS